METQVLNFVLDHSTTLAIALFLTAAIVMIGFVIKCGSTPTPEDQSKSADRDVSWLKGD